MRGIEDLRQATISAFKARQEPAVTKQSMPLLESTMKGRNAATKMIKFVDDVRDTRLKPHRTRICRPVTVAAVALGLIKSLVRTPKKRIHAIVDRSDRDPG